MKLLLLLACAILGNGSSEAHKENLSYDTYSDSREETDRFKEKMRLFWAAKQDQLFKTNITYTGDIVSMYAARPWGNDCRNPSDHDVAWGRCMLAAECEPEYRIYKGDHDCGNTMFICCNLIPNDDWDLNLVPDDMSFDDSGIETDARERQLLDAKQKRVNIHRLINLPAKESRQRKIKKHIVKKMIKRITLTIFKLMSQLYRNSSIDRYKMIKKINWAVKEMKKRYATEKKNLKEVNQIMVAKLEEQAVQTLHNILETNMNFVFNKTYAEIVSQDFLSLSQEDMLRTKDPEFWKYLEDNRATKNTLNGKPPTYQESPAASLNFQIPNEDPNLNNNQGLREGSKMAEASYVSPTPAAFPAGVNSNRDTRISLTQISMKPLFQNPNVPELYKPSSYLVGATSNGVTSLPRGSMAPVQNLAVSSPFKPAAIPVAPSNKDSSLPEGSMVKPVITVNSKLPTDYIDSYQSQLDAKFRVFQKLKQAAALKGIKYDPSQYPFFRGRRSDQPDVKDYLEYDIEYGFLYQ